MNVVDIRQLFNENTEGEFRTSKQLSRSSSPGGEMHHPRSDQEASIPVESASNRTLYHFCLTTTESLGSFVGQAAVGKHNVPL